MENKPKTQRPLLFLPRGESNTILTKCKICKEIVSARAPQGKLLFDMDTACYDCGLLRALELGNQRMIASMRAAIAHYTG